MQKTAYDMRISDWSSDVCASDLIGYAFEGKESHAIGRGIEYDPAGAKQDFGAIEGTFRRSALRSRRVRNEADKLDTVLGAADPEYPQGSFTAGERTASFHARDIQTRFQICGSRRSGRAYSFADNEIYAAACAGRAADRSSARHGEPLHQARVW